MMRILAFSAVMAMLCAASPRAATLHPRVVLHGATVRLSDLFGDLQPGQDCDLGPAPAPGAQLVIPPSQLAAIASQFGVDWQATGRFTPVVIERPIRAVRRDEVIAALKPALIAGGAGADAAIAVGIFAPPPIPADDLAPPEVQALDFDPQTGRFTATMQFAVSDSDPIMLRITGRAEQQQEVVVLRQALPAGAVLDADGLQTMRIRTSLLHGLPVASAADAAGLALRLPVPAGKPLTRDMLVRPVEIVRGRPVVLRLDADGLSLTAAGTALEPGSIGDRIHVLNTLSHAVLVGEITSRTDIRIEPGTAPTAQPGGPRTGLPQFAGGTTGMPPSWNTIAQEARSP